MTSPWPYESVTLAKQIAQGGIAEHQGAQKTAESESENVILYYSLINNIKYNIYIYNNNVTLCYCAWIVACHVVLPIFPLFNLQFCKVRLHFSYVLFFLFLLAKIHALPFLPCHACHLWHLLDFISLFLAKTPAKTCQTACQNGKPLILKGFLFVKYVMGLFYSTLSLIIILEFKTCLLLNCCCCLTA